MRKVLFIYHSSNTVLLIVLLSLITLLTSACDKTQYKAGDVFPIETLQQLITTSNKPVDIKGKILIINFWATWCHPCREEMPSLQKLSDSLDKAQFQVIAISIDDDENLMQEFLIQNAITFNNYHDPKKILTQQQLNIQAYPETIIVAPDGIIIKRVSGEQSWNKQYLKTLLQ